MIVIDLIQVLLFFSSQPVYIIFKLAGDFVFARPIEISVHCILNKAVQSGQWRTKRHREVFEK